MTSLPKDEGVHIGEVTKGHFFVFGEVTVIVVHPHEHELARGASTLQGGGELAGLSPDDARVIHVAHAHNGGVFGAGHYVLEGVHPMQTDALHGIFTGPNSGALTGPLDEFSLRRALEQLPLLMAAANKSGRSVGPSAGLLPEADGRTRHRLEFCYFEHIEPAAG